MSVPISRCNRQNGEVILDRYGILRRADSPEPDPPPQGPVQLHFSAEDAEAMRRDMLGERPMPDSVWPPRLRLP